MELLPRVTEEDVDKHFGISSATACLPLIDGQTDKKKKKLSKKPLLPPDIDLSKVLFSNHALWRLAQWTLLQNPKFQTSLRLIEVAEKILAGSTEKDAISPTHKVKRCITHGFHEARYFVNHGWRFVVLEEYEARYKIVTIERMRGYDHPPNKMKTMADIMSEDENQ